MKKNIALVFLYFVVITLVSFSAFSQSKPEPDIISVAVQAVTAQENYDPATLEKIYAADYIEISPKGEIDMRDKAIGFYKVSDVESAKAKTPRYILDEFNVRRHKDHAIIITRFSVGSKTDQERKPTAVGLAVYCLRREKGGWKIYSSQFTPFPPPPRPQPNK